MRTHMEGKGVASLATDKRVERTLPDRTSSPASPSGITHRPLRPYDANVLCTRSCFSMQPAVLIPHSSKHTRRADVKVGKITC